MKPLGEYAYVFTKLTGLQFPINEYHSAYDKDGNDLYGAFNIADMTNYLMNNYSSTVYVTDDTGVYSSVEDRQVYIKRPRVV